MGRYSDSAVMTAGCGRPRGIHACIGVSALEVCCLATHRGPPDEESDHCAVEAACPEAACHHRELLEFLCGPGSSRSLAEQAPDVCTCLPTDASARQTCVWTFNSSAIADLISALHGSYIACPLVYNSFIQAGARARGQQVVTKLGIGAGLRGWSAGRRRCSRGYWS